MPEIISIIGILAIPLALIIAFIVFAKKAARSFQEYLNANPKRKVSLASIALTLLLAIALIIFGERLLYDINRWFNPVYGALPVDFRDIRDTIRRAINIGLGIGGIVSGAGFILCGLTWLRSYLHKRQTHVLVKILFALSILGALIIIVLWMLVSYTLTITSQSRFIN